MKARFFNIAGLAIALAVFGSVAIGTIRAQQSPPKPAAPPVTTNWIGYLVVGQTDPVDRIVRDPTPTTVRQVEIGLRSDGVVVWQESKQIR